MSKCRVNDTNFEILCFAVMVFHRFLYIVCYRFSSLRQISIPAVVIQNNRNDIFSFCRYT